jgi:hypothetical protein
MKTFESALKAADRLPMFVGLEIQAQVFAAYDGEPADMIEARTLFQNGERIMNSEQRQIGRDLLATLDLDAIAAEGVADRAEAATDKARQRLADIGLDESFLNIELKGCTFAEHLEWINTAPAEELRAYRAEMLGGAA